MDKQVHMEGIEADALVIGRVILSDDNVYPDAKTIALVKGDDDEHFETIAFVCMGAEEIRDLANKLEQVAFRMELDKITRMAFRKELN